MYDLLFKNGMVIDGTGAPAFRADVAVQAGSISAVEPGISGDSAAEVHDIAGQCIAPGFIDLHTHSDFPLLVDGRALSALHQGVTTQVIGNCGFSPAPLKQSDDIRRNVFCFRGPYSPDWREFGDFLDCYDAIRTGTNTAVLAGHGALRSWGMGYENRSPRGDELELIDRQLREALEAGAFGLSTGLEYAPGSNADRRELNRLCATVAEYGGLYATHVRNRDEQYQQGFDEAFRSAEESGVRLQISHAVPKYGAPPEAAQWFLERLHLAAGGTDVAADVIPYEWGPTSLSAVLPKELLRHGPSEIAGMLQSRDVREKVVNQERPFWLHFRDGLWDQVVLYYSEKFPDLVGKNAWQIGDFFHTDPFNGLLSVLEGERETMFSVLMMGKIKNRAHLDLLIRDPLVGVISDAMSLASDGPLSSVIWSPGCYGWVPHFFHEFIGKGKLLTLEQGIEKITGFPARRLGLSDRGCLRRGARADLTVFDPEHVSENASMEDPRRYAGGFSYVVCNGETVIEDGRYTEKLPGKLLRRGAM